MNFSLAALTREIALAISACGQVVEGNSKIDILKCIRISVDNGIASLVATNTDQTVTARLACEGQGVICINSQALSAKISALKPGEIVRMEGDGKFATITQGRTKWKVPVFLDDFPMQVASKVEGDAIEVGKDFISALSVAKGAVLANSLTNYAGVWADGGHVVAVDGKQMRIIAGPDLPTCILPPAAVDRITSLFKDGGSAVITANAAQFSNDTVTLKTKLFEGKPSDWRAGLDRFRKAAVNSCTVDGPEFVAAIKRAAAITVSAEAAGSFVNMQLRFRSDRVEIFTRNRLDEEGLDHASSEGGTDMDIGMNGGLLIDAISSLTGQLKISYGLDRDAIIVEPVKSHAANIRIVFPRIFS